MNTATRPKTSAAQEIDPDDAGQTKLPSDWYLIQRLKRQNHPSDTARGIDRLIGHDYMGSSEFEWGVIPKVWKKIREVAMAGDLHVIPVEVVSSGPVPKRRSVWVLAHVGAHLPTLKAKLCAVADHKQSTKERTGFDAYFGKNPASEFERKTIGWLVVNDYRHGNNAMPLMWTIEKNLADSIYREVTSQCGVKAEDLHLFQQIEFRKQNNDRKGEVKGIFDEHALVEVESGVRLEVPYVDIWKVRPKAVD